MKRLLHILLALEVLSVAAVTILPPLWPLIPRATMFAPMAPQCAALGSLLAAIAILAQRRWMAALCFVVAAWNTMLIWPAIAPFRAQAAAEGGPAIKIVNLNLWYGNEHLDQVADYFIASGADVIGVIEATPVSKALLGKVKSVYPYSVDCIAPDSDCQNILFSKYPLKNTYAGPIDGRYPFIAMADVALPDGRLITVAAAHVMTPFTRFRPPLGAVAPGPPPHFPDAPALEQSDQAANLAAFLRRQKQDFVLVGDFNSAPWSPLQRAFRAASGLDNRGPYLPSWPTALWPIFRIPLDPVFTRGRAQVTEIRLGPNVGSDHLPIEAEIALLP